MFYGVGPKTVATLSDVTNVSSSVVGTGTNFGNLSMSNRFTFIHDTIVYRSMSNTFAYLATSTNAYAEMISPTNAMVNGTAISFSRGGIGNAFNHFFDQGVAFDRLGYWQEDARYYAGNVAFTDLGDQMASFNFCVYSNYADAIAGDVSKAIASPVDSSDDPTDVCVLEFNRTRDIVLAAELGAIKGHGTTITNLMYTQPDYGSGTLHILGKVQITNLSANVSFTGNGSGLTNIPLTGLSSNGAVSGQIVTYRDGVGWSVSNAPTVSTNYAAITDPTFLGTVTSTNFRGNASLLTNYFTNWIIASKNGVVGDNAWQTNGAGTDDIAAWQAILDRASNGPVFAVQDKVSLISTSLIVRSNITLYTLPGCGFMMKPGTYSHLLRTDWGAGFDQASTHYGDAGGAKAQNITIIGGVWDGNEQNSLRDNGPFPNIAGFGFDFFNFNNVVIRDVTIRNAKTYATLFANGTNLWIQNVRTYWDRGGQTNLTTAHNWDSLHFLGPVRGIHVDGFYSNGDDDVIALNTSEGLLEYGGTWPADMGISEGVFENFFLDNVASVFRLLYVNTNSPNPIPMVNNITLHNISGTSLMPCSTSTAIGAYNCGYPSLGAFAIDGWNVRTNGGIPNGATLLTLHLQNADRLRLNGIDLTKTAVELSNITNSTGDYFNFQNTTNLHDLTVLERTQGVIILATNNGNADISLRSGNTNGYWSMTANDGTPNFGSFLLYDVKNAKTPFTVESNTPSSTLYLSKNGFVGINTSGPTNAVTVNGTMKAGLTWLSGLNIVGATDNADFTLRTADKSGFWDIAAAQQAPYYGALTLYNVNSTRSPMTIESNAPTDSIHVTSAGGIGHGTAAPAAKLDVVGGIASSNWISTNVSFSLGGIQVTNPGGNNVFLGTNGNVTASGSLSVTGLVSGAFASMTMATGVVTTAAAAQNKITNFNYTISSGPIGIVTNTWFVVTNAGIYRVSFGSGIASGNADTCELQLWTNGPAITPSQCNVISLNAVMGTPAVSETGFKETRVYLPAGCHVFLQTSNSTTTAQTLKNITFNIGGAH